MSDGLLTRVLAREFPGWELLGREMEGAWYARLPDADPVVIAFGDDFPDLLCEIHRKVCILQGRPWPL